MTYTEYQEVTVPQEIQDKLAELQQKADPANPATLSGAGFFDWLNKKSKEEGWRPVWPGFHFPFIVLEREVTEE